MKKKKIPKFKSDQEAADFLDLDLSDLEWSQFTSAQFELLPKDKTITIRISGDLLKATKASATKLGIDYQKFIRIALENQLRSDSTE